MAIRQHDVGRRRVGGVQNLREDAKRQAGNADVSHEARRFELVQRRQCLASDLHRAPLDALCEQRMQAVIGQACCKQHSDV